MKAQLQHVGIYCKNLDESLDFYVNKLGFKILFLTDAMEGDKPIKMAWIRGFGCAIELIEQEDKTTILSAQNCQNHTAFRVDDMDAFVNLLKSNDIPIEAGPFDPPLIFDRPLDTEDADLFAIHSKAGVKLRIMFFRGPGGERFEVLQDNIGGL